MTEASIRIALLARAGDARNQLHRALTERGAELVAEGDPAEMDPDALIQLKPTVVLISLEPAIEEALPRFDALLSMDGVAVMFDDAEVTQQLAGWDLARWARHLAAKLLGHDLLPPVPAGATGLGDVDFMPSPGAPLTPSELMADARLEDYTAEASEMASDVPTTPSLLDVEVPSFAEADVQDVEVESADMSLDIDLSMLEAAMAGQAVEPSRVEPSTIEPASSQDEAVADLSFGALAAQHAAANDESDFTLDIDMDVLERSLAEHADTSPAAAADESIEHDAADAGLMLDFDSEEPVRFSSYAAEEMAESVLDADVAALAEAFEAAPMDSLPELESELPTPAMTPAPVAENDAPKPRFGSLELSLVDDYAPVSPSTDAAKPAAQAASGLFAGLSLSLVGDDAPAASASAAVTAPPVPGLVLVLAGVMGGADAIRQLLAALPKSLPVPVLLYQQLGNGKFDRLTEQLAKASTLPVSLAREGELLASGRVMVLPDGMDIATEGEGMRFMLGDSLGKLIRGLPAEHSVVVVLSGTDAALVPDLIALQQQGALLLAQSPDSCFEAAAAQDVVSAGASMAAPGELPQLISARWSA